MLKQTHDFHRKSGIQQDINSSHPNKDFNLRKNLMERYIWSKAVYGAGTGTLRKVDKKYLESVKYGTGEG
jgi:hypothetical protein